MLKIRAFLPTDQLEARALILAGLRERFNPYFEGFDDDLLDIAANFPVFLIGLLEGRIVATCAISSLARVERVSVAIEHRGRGFAKTMMQALLLEAHSRGISKLCLQTGADWISAIALYKSLGFVQVGVVSDAATGFVGLEFERMLDL